MKKVGRPSIYGPMLKQVKVGEFLSFQNKPSAIACMRYMRLNGIARRFETCTSSLYKITTYRVYKLRKPRVK